MALRNIAFTQKIKTKLTLISATAVFALTSSGLPLTAVSASTPPTNVSVCATGCDYTTLQDGVNNVAVNGVVELRAETYLVSTTVTVNKSVTLAGQPGTVIQRGGTVGSVITINASDVVMSGINFVAPTSATFTFINLNGNNTTIANNTFIGQYTLNATGTDGNVSRALVASGGKTGLIINGNTFTNLRQPGYLNASSGTISNNHTSGTKGWVVVSQSNFNFINNTWGTGAAKNAVDIAIIADPGTHPDNYIANLMQISAANNNAVIEDQKPAGGAVLTDVFVNASAPTLNNNGYPITPYQTVTPALTRVAEGGRVHVADGTYTEKLTFVKNGTQLLGESRTGVVLSPLSGPTGQGLTSEGLSNITVKNLTIKATTASGGYALKIHNGINFNLSDLTLIGPGSGTPTVGGLDINGINGVSLSNISVSNFTKNGIAITSKFAASDPQTSNVQINSVSSTNNAWSGLAFYSLSNTGIGGNIENVTFTGTNAFTGNGQVGLFVQGDTNANYSSNATPRQTVTGPSGAVLDLGTTAFGGNSVEINNYQTSGIKALSATFNGKTGTAMDAAERTIADASIVDHLDFSDRGLVAYYTLDAPTGLAPANNTFTTDNDFNNTWNPVPGAISYNYRTSNSINGDGSLGPIIYSDTSASPNYTIDPTLVTRRNSDAPDNKYYWQVQAVDAQGNPGAWSPVHLVTLDTGAPSIPTNGLPNGGYSTTNDFYFTWDASTDAAGNAIVYEYQASQNSAQQNGVLTTDVWKSSELSTPTIHSTGAPDGVWYWQVRAKDAAGNYSAWSPIWSMTIDTTKPATPTGLSLRDSLDQTITDNGFTSSYQIKSKWDSVSDADHYNYKYWNNLPGSAHNSPASAYIVNTGSALEQIGEFTEGEGTHYISVQAVDAAGNASDWSAPFVVTYDKTPPAVAITSPTFGATINGNTLTVKGTVDDANIDFYQYYIVRSDNTVFGLTQVDSTRVINDTLATFNISSLPNGNYKIRVIAQDKAGNRVDADVAPFSTQFAVQRAISAPPSTGGFGSIITSSATTPVSTAGQTNTAPTAIATNTEDNFAVADTSEVLGETTEQDGTVNADKTTPEIKAVSTEKAASAVGNNKFLGLGWWWLLILALIAGILYFLYQRRLQEDV